MTRHGHNFLRFLVLLAHLMQALRIVPFHATVDGVLPKEGSIASRKSDNELFVRTTLALPPGTDDSWVSRSRTLRDVSTGIVNLLSSEKGRAESNNEVGHYHLPNGGHSRCLSSPPARAGNPVHCEDETN